MAQVCLNLAAALMALTGAMHSFFGERRLLGPLLAIDNSLTQRPLARWVLRAAWHLTTLLMLICALAVWRAADSSMPIDTVVITAIGLVWLIAGLLDLLGSKGKHIGWPPLTLAGMLVLVAAY